MKTKNIFLMSFIVFILVGCGSPQYKTGDSFFRDIDASGKNPTYYKEGIYQGSDFFVVNPYWQKYEKQAGLLVRGDRVVQPLTQEDISKIRSALGQQSGVSIQLEASSNKKPKYPIGMRMGDFLNGRAKNNFDYKFTCDYNCAAYTVYDDPDYVYIIDNDNQSDAKISRILSKKDLDDKKQSIAKNLQSQKDQYEINVAEQKLKLSSRVDVVAQVLNYSSGCKDQGCDSYTWAVKEGKKCVYEKVNISGGKDNTFGLIQNFIEMATALDSPAFGNVGSASNEINLNDLDPKSLQIVTMNRASTKTKEITDPKNYTRVIGYNNIVTKYQTQEVQYMGKPIFSQQNLDVDRLKRGWSLIYSKHCSGTKKAF